MTTNGRAVPLRADPTLSTRAHAERLARDILGGRATLSRALWGWLKRNPMQKLAALAVAGATIVILANMLVVQRGRHLAPLFPQVEESFSTAAVPLPPARPPDLAAMPIPAMGEPAIGARVQPASSSAGPPPARDSIRDLLRQQDSVRTGESGSEPGNRQVAEVQKALTKLGYGPLKPDGRFGLSTKAALERFERERKLPVRGDLNGRTLRDLASLAGMPLE